MSAKTCQVISLKPVRAPADADEGPKSILTAFSRTFEQLDQLSKQVMDSAMTPTDKCAIVGPLGASAATIYQANLAYLTYLTQQEPKA